jgi:predicted anti-sigma-YlaC factor YlaD
MNEEKAMSHLNQEQISAWLAGLQTPEQSAHVTQCVACRREIARREEPLALFRESVRAISEERPAGAIVWSTPARWRLPMLRWAAGAALALVMLGLPVIYWNKQTHLREAERARQDAALLESVNSELSRSVPRPLEPLDKLVAWSPTGSSATESKSKQ